MAKGPSGRRVESKSTFSAVKDAFSQAPTLFTLSMGHNSLHWAFMVFYSLSYAFQEEFNRCPRRSGSLLLGTKQRLEMALFIAWLFRKAIQVYNSVIGKHYWEEARRELSFIHHHGMA